MLFAAARPQAVVTLPSNQQTIILAMDVSGSMRATDVQPSRLDAAQDAAKAFMAELPRHVKVGIVAFAGTAQVAQLPTPNREDLVTAIDRFQLQRATATGNAIVISLATLFPDAGIDARVAAARAATGSAAFSLDGREAGARRSSRRWRRAPITLGGDHHADRRPAHHRRRSAGSSQDGGRPRRARLHGGHRHGRRRDHRLRGLVDARAAGRGNAQGDRATRPTPSTSTPAPRTTCSKVYQTLELAR